MRKNSSTRKTKFISTLLCCAVLLSLFSPFFSEITVNADEDKTPIMVSIGDSFSSGEGIEPFYAEEESDYYKVRNQDWLAHRSTKSWSGMLKLPGVNGTMADNRGENWFFAATSGVNSSKEIAK